eukprot:8263907-Pyramimonas_sp.AAC.1
MFGTAAGAHLRELSEYGRFAKLWVRFQGGNLGKRTLLRIDKAFDPIGDLTTWIPPAPTHAGDDSIKGFDDAIKKAKARMESSFADRIAAPLDPQFSWDKLSAALADSMRKLVDHPTLGILLYA